MNKKNGKIFNVDFKFGKICNLFILVAKYVDKK